MKFDEQPLRKMLEDAIPKDMKLQVPLDGSESDAVESVMTQIAGAGLAPERDEVAELVREIRSSDDTDG